MKKISYINKSWEKRFITFNPSETDEEITEVIQTIIKQWATDIYNESMPPIWPIDDFIIIKPKN